MPNAALPVNLTSADISSWLQQQLRWLRQKNQRQLLSIQGNQAWCDRLCELVLDESDDILILSDRLVNVKSIAYSRVETILGSDASLVIVDLFRGINPDVLCIASGLVKSGGLLVLLSPQPENWSGIQDRFAIWQDEALSPKPNFARYFFQILCRFPQAFIALKESEMLPHPVEVPQGFPTELKAGKTREQVAIMDEIDTWLTDDRRPIALISAHRGRGKSACLGFIVRELVKPRAMRVLVSAYSRRSAATLLHFAGEVEFVAPDQLIASPRIADLLIIDEAAMLPYSMLMQLCRRYPRVLMATTTGGYEGTGQGFLLRFVAGFSQNEILRLSIEAPVRWTSQDCLETCLDAALLLQSPTAEIAAVVTAPECIYRVIDPVQCTDTELLLRVYALMVFAHYRTRPSDLRMLMENPDLLIVLAEAGDELVGVLILNREGGFDQDLCEQVYLGKRRPKGHLLAQMITAQAGVKLFATYRGLRIQRIAVLESNRRLGVGRRLVEKAIAYACDQGYDYIGASFAFARESSLFWERCQFRLVHIGFGQGKSSGNHSVVVLRCLNRDLEALVAQLQLRIQRQLPVWMCQFLQFMDAASVAALLRLCCFKAEINALERAEVDAFLYGHRGFELCFASLQPYVMQAIAQMPEQKPIPRWVIEKAVQNRRWDQLELDLSVTGRKQIQQQLRSSILAIL